MVVQHFLGCRRIEYSIDYGLRIGVSGLLRQIIDKVLQANRNVRTAVGRIERNIKSCFGI